MVPITDLWEFRAVTLSTAIVGKKPWGEAFVYMAIQLAGTFFASMLVWLLFGVGHVTFGPTFEAVPMLTVYIICSIQFAHR